MKKLFVLAVIPFLFISCSKPGANATLEKQMTSGFWTVDLFTINGTDRTSEFWGYTFYFENDGDIVADTSGFLTTGSWVRTNASNENPKMRFNFGSTSPLNLWNDEFQAVYREQNLVRYEEIAVSGSNDNKVLVLERN